MGKQHRIEISNSYTNNNTNIPRNIIQSKNNIKKSTLENVLSLWSGIGPSIILCSNPAIHYTFYDVMKLYALQQRKTKSEKLSMNEAFCIGFLAKLLATIVTYPFIRTKVILMAGSTHTKGQIQKQQEQSSNNDNSIKQKYNLILKSIPFLRILSNIYKGCMMQIMHTALKSAIVMMMKERVSSKVHAILGRFFLKYAKEILPAWFVTILM